MSLASVEMSDSDQDFASPRSPKKKNGFHKGPIELYVVKINPACRAVWLYMLQNDILHVVIDVDFSHGKDNLPLVFRSQPHQEVPLIVDGDVTVFEGQAILRYLATKYTDHAGFGINIQQQMTTESIISWAFGELHRVVGYNYIYPQYLEKYALPLESANELLIETGLKEITKNLEILEKKYLKGNKRYLTGDRSTIADICVGIVLVLLEWSGFRFKMWPQVEAWLGRVKRQHFWDNVHKTHTDFVDQLHNAHMILD